ncbi:MAG: hypothetical protein ABW073_02875 [Acidimicrobiia bacterium]
MLHGFARHDRTERAWTEHLATSAGARALLEAVARARLPAQTAATLHEILLALAVETTDDVGGGASPRSSRCAIHQFHVAGKYPDVAINDPRDRLFAVIEAQRGRADDRHIAKLATNYVPNTGARLGILVAEGWRRADAGHPAWVECPAPVVVVVTRDALCEPDYEVVWVHSQTVADRDDGQRRWSVVFEPDDSV